MSDEAIYRREMPSASLEEKEIFHVLVGDSIHRMRKQRGWTQVELATRASLSSNYIARLERGELGASLYVARSIARAFGVEVDALVR